MEQLVDDPNIDDRRVHKEPTPRWGGLSGVRDGAYGS